MEPSTKRASTPQNKQPLTNKQKGATHTETKAANATHIKIRTNAYLQILEPTLQHWQTIAQHTETINQIQNLAATAITTQDPVTFQQLETQIQTLLCQTQAQNIWLEATQKLQQILNQTGIINPEAYTEQIIKKTQNKLKRLVPIAPEPQQRTPDNPPAPTKEPTPAKTAKKATKTTTKTTTTTAKPTQQPKPKAKAPAKQKKETK